MNRYRQAWTSARLRAQRLRAELDDARETNSSLNRSVRRSMARAGEQRIAAESARERLQRVRDLHRPAPGAGYLADGGWGDIDPACTTCGTEDEYAVPWPCPTIRAIGEEDNQ